MTVPLLADLGAPELLIIFAVIVLLFGAAKLPELARSSGRALRIFKAETKGLIDDDENKTPEQHQIDAANRSTGDAPTAAPTTPVAQTQPRDTGTPPGTL